MKGAWLMLSCLAVVVIVLCAQAWLAWRWHHHGGGERAARDEYARMRREQVDSAETRLPEAEFVRYYIGSHPGFARYVVAALVLLLIGLPASCALMGSWP